MYHIHLAFMIKFFQHVILSWRWFSLILRTYMCDEFITIGSLVLYIRCHCYSSFRYYHRHASFTAQEKKRCRCLYMTKLYQQIAFSWHHSAFYDLCIYRQSHKSFFGKSDLFFVCMLRPLSHDIYPQELEIEAAQVKEETRLVKANYRPLVLHTSNCFFLE